MSDLSPVDRPMGPRVFTLLESRLRASRSR